MLAERSTEHASFFEEGREIVCFESVAELRERIDFFLAHPAEREAIAKAGFDKVTQHGHSYVDRAKSILNVYYDMAAARRS